MIFISLDHRCEIMDEPLQVNVMPINVVPIMEELKSHTAGLHRSAEMHQFQQALAQGALDKRLYIGYLSQLYLVHNTLETALAKHSDSQPLNLILLPHQYQEPFLKQDLQYFGTAVDEIKASAPTASLLENITRTEKQAPAAMLGFHYVLWGSKHGGRFLGKALAKQYQLPGSDGTSYFDPYGPKFIEYWRLFVERMNAAQFSQLEREAMLAAAGEMFLGVTDIGQAILEEPIES